MFEKFRLSRSGCTIGVQVLPDLLKFGDCRDSALHLARFQAMRAKSLE